MNNVCKGKRKSRNLFEKGLVHFMSISLLIQLFGLNFTNKLVYADNINDKLSNQKVSLLKEPNGDPVNEFLLSDNVVIKYDFIIPKWSEVSDNTEYKFNIPEQFNKCSEGDTDFKAVTNKIEKPLKILQEEQDKIIDNSEKKVDKKETDENINKEKPEKDINEKNKEDASMEKIDDNKNTDVSDQSKKSETEVNTESDVNKEDNKVNNIEPKNETNSDAKESETKETVNNEESKVVKEKSQEDSEVVKIDQNTETKANPVSLEKEKTVEVSVDLAKSISVEDNVITVATNSIVAEEDIKCTLFVNTTINQDKVKINEAGKVKFNINSKEISYDVTFKSNVAPKGKEIPASDFITGAYISDESFSSDIDKENCPMNPNFEEYIKKHKIENFNPDLNSIYTCYKFKVPDAGKIEKGDGFTLTLPKGIANPDKDKTTELNTDKGITIGNVYFRSDNTVKVVFNEFVSENSNVEGYFWFGRRIDKKIIENTEKVDVVYTIGEKSFTFTVNLKHTDKSPSINKTGKYDRANNVINWEITINPGNKAETFKNYTVYDELKEPTLNSFIKDSLIIDNEAMPNKTDCFGGNKFKYTFEEIQKNENHCIKFKTKLKNEVIDSVGTNYSINNIAILKDGNDDNAKELCDKDATVNILNDYIKKTGWYDANGKQVVWDISINNSNMTLKDVVVKDEIDTSVFKMPEVTDITADGGTVSISGSTIEIKYSEIKEIKKIKIKAKVKDDIYLSSFDIEKKVKNTASIYIDNKLIDKSTSGEVKIGKGEDVIQKWSDPKTGIVTDPITWKIRVNKGGLKINNAKLYEILSNNQKFESASIYKKDNTFVKEIDQLLTDSNNKNYIDLGNLEEEYIIIVTTKLIEDNFKDERSKNALVKDKVFNTSVLKGDKLKSDGYSATAYKSIDTTVLQKRGIYNKDSRTIDWKIIINSSHNPITNAVFTDIIPEGQEYDENSFAIKNLQTNQIDKKLSSYTPVDINNPSKGATLTYEFGRDKKVDAYEITYKTKISNDTQYTSGNSNFIAKNEAQLNASEFSNPVVIKAEVRIENFLIQKNCAYKDGDDFITWEVKINQNNVTLNNMTIIDTLPKGLKLDSDTLKLYKVKYLSNGTIDGDKSLVPQSDYNVDYEISTGILKIKYAGVTKDSFLLTFETPVLINLKEYTNTVSVESEGTKYVTTRKSKLVRFDEYGGGARGERGTINIVKVDKNNETHKLAGAKFKLIRKSDNKVMDYTDSESTSDTDGKVTFKRVKYGDYLIREIQAPKGYECAKDQEVTISSATETVNLKFTDEFIVVKDIDINLAKSFSDNKAGTNVNDGSGAEFTLYSDEACTTPVSDSAINKEALWDGFKYVVTFKGNYLAKNTKYYLKETKAPEGYSLNNTIYCCNIDSDGNVTYAEKNSEGAISAYGSEIPVCLDNKNDSGGGSSSGGGHHHHHSSSDDGNNSNDQPVINPENPDNNPKTSDVKGSEVVEPNNIPNPTPAISPANNSIIPKDDTSEKNSNIDNGTPSKSEKITHSKNRLPQAGTMIDTKVLFVLGVIFVIIGLGINFRKRHYN